MWEQCRSTHKYLNYKQRGKLSVSVFSTCVYKRCTREVDYTIGHVNLLKSSKCRSPLVHFLLLGFMDAHLFLQSHLIQKNLNKGDSKYKNSSLPFCHGNALSARPNTSGGAPEHRGMRSKLLINSNFKSFI